MMLRRGRGWVVHCTNVTPTGPTPDRVAHLRAARQARGWSQLQLMRELDRAAARGGVALMSANALRVALSRWENGHHAPDRVHARLLAQVLEQPALDPDRPPALPLLDPATTDDTVAALLTAQTDTLRRLDRRLGAVVVRAQIAAHVDTLAQLLDTAAGADHVALARVQADAAALAAWQDLDVGDAPRAAHHYALARTAAGIAGDPVLFAHAVGEQAVLLTETGRAEMALQQVRTVERLPLLPPLLRSWLAATRAETAAALGDAAQAREGLRDAESLLQAADPADAGALPFLALDDVHLARWRGNVLVRLGDPAGGDLSAQSLAGLPAEFVRARGHTLLDLATAQANAGQRDEAEHHTAAVVPLLSTLRSARLDARLVRVTALLTA